jgi:DNA modification methylase
VSVRILIGDCRERLRELPDSSVHCCVTSPPYFGLRDYGCAGQMGLEATPAEFVEGMVALFREVRRVLRDDGTLWLNLGDSYAGGGGGNYNTTGKTRANGCQVTNVRNRPDWLNAAGLKTKDLIGIPWRIAFALQADGWWLRQDIIWSKPNPMPESVRDRCTKAHEYLFLLSKGPRYYYDAEAIAEPANGWNGSAFDTGKTAIHQLDRSQKRSKGNARSFRGGGAYTQGQSFDNSAAAERDSAGNVPNETGVRNKRSVWEVATAPFSEAHFATYPPALIEPCILAGCPTGGIVLDPFGGAGTTGMVSDRLGRSAILIELNPEYAALARRRIEGDAGMFAEVQAA